MPSASPSHHSPSPSRATQTEWDSMPASLDEIDMEIHSLEAETSSEVGASEDSLKQYQRREEQIAEVRPTPQGRL